MPRIEQLYSLEPRDSLDDARLLRAREHLLVPHAQHRRAHRRAGLRRARVEDVFAAMLGRRHPQVRVRKAARRRVLQIAVEDGVVHRAAAPTPLPLQVLD